MTTSNRRILHRSSTSAAACALLALAAATPGLARAQAAKGSRYALGAMDGLPTDPVLQELIDESLAARPELKQAEATVRAERERVPQVGALPDPTLSLGIQNDGFEEIMVGEMDSSFYQVMLSQPLPWPGKRGLREDVAKLAAKGAESDVARLRLSTEAEVRRGYLDLLVTRERLALLDELERVWEKSIGTARARYEAGDGAQSDVMRAQLELLRLRQRRWSLQAEEAARLQALNRLRARPLDAPVSTSSSVRDQPLPAVPALDAATSDAETRSPELAAARTAASQAEAQTRLARRERFPDVALQAGIMLRGRLDPMWTAGISVGLPLWSGRKQSRAVAESEARASGSTLGAEAVLLTLHQRVAERRAALGSLLETIDLYRKGLLVQSQATTESALSQYRVGKVTFASVLDANAGYLNDQEAHLLAVADAQRIAIATAEVSLEPAGGAGGGAAMSGASVPGAGAAGGGRARGAGGGSGGSAPAAAPAAGGSMSGGM
jgi:outer membrane protein TolC